MKRLTVLLLALLMALAVIGPAVQAEEPVTLSIWLNKTWSDDTNATMEARVNQFAEENGIDVELTIVNSSDITSMFNANMISGEWPDVFFTNTANYGYLQDAGLFMDISDVIADVEAEMGPFSANFIEPFKAGGNVAMPHYSECRVLFYRTDILEQCGFDAPPATWEELYEMSKVIKEKTGLYGYGTPMAYGSDDLEQDAHTWLWSFGGAEYTEDGSACAVDSQESRDMLNFFVNMYNEGLIPESATSWDDSGNNTSFLSGQSAFITNAATVWEALKGEGMEEIQANSAMAPMPAGPAGLKIYTEARWLAVWNETEHPDEAKALLKYMVAPDFYPDWIASLAPVQAPVFENMASDEVWAEYPGSVAYSCLAAGEFAGYPAGKTSLGSAVQNDRNLGKAFQDMILNGISVDDAIAQWKTSVEAQMVG